MRLLPRSLAGRLAGVAAVAIAAALALSAFAIGHVLERFVMHGLDERLDAQIAIVARAVRPDGTLDPRFAIDMPPFDRAGSGWAWEVIGPRGRLRSASLGGGDLALPEAPPPADDGRPRPFDGRNAAGRLLHYRMLTAPAGAGAAAVIAAGPRAIAERPLREAMAPLVISLALVALLLSVAVIVQLRIGLRPLARLRAAVAAVRAGQARTVAVSEPTELLPLVAELNALIDANARSVAAARMHLANMAHGLKTPLATLHLDLSASDDGRDGALAAQVARIEAQVRHHLGRARAEGTAMPSPPAVPLRPVLGDLAAALSRIHHERGIAHRLDAPVDLSVRCDPQDLDELLGNLLDNAWRWARTGVAIVAVRDGAMAAIAIDDDGPGLDAGITAARDDEREGHGFGLSISRSLIELHGGTLDLGRAPAGGLAVRIRLPAGSAIRAP